MQHVPFDGYLSTGSYDELTQYSPANLFREDYTSESFCSEADKACSVTGIATEPLHSNEVFLHIKLIEKILRAYL